MEMKCKNCQCFHQAHTVGSGEMGTCGMNGTLTVHNREDLCDCNHFVVLPKKEKIARTIEKLLKSWVRERDAMFVRSMELVAHIGQLFENGEFKVFDAVKSASEMKGLVFFGKDTLHKIDRVWTYHCPWNEDREQFIAISADGKLVTNTWSDEGAVTSFVDIESNFDDCMNVIDRIRENCIMKTKTNSVIETEEHKCVSDKKEEWRESALKHPINKEDDEAIHNIPWAMETFLGTN